MLIKQKVSYMRAKNFPRLCPCVPALHRSGVVLLGDNPLPHHMAKGLSAQSPLSFVSLRCPDLVY